MSFNANDLQQPLDYLQLRQTISALLLAEWESEREGTHLSEGVVDGLIHFRSTYRWCEQRLLKGTWTTENPAIDAYLPCPPKRTDVTPGDELHCSFDELVDADEEDLTCLGWFDLEEPVVKVRNIRLLDGSHPTQTN